MISIAYQRSDRMSAMLAKQFKLPRDILGNREKSPKKHLPVSTEMNVLFPAPVSPMTSMYNFRGFRPALGVRSVFCNLWLGAIIATSRLMTSWAEDRNNWMNCWMTRVFLGRGNKGRTKTLVFWAGNLRSTYEMCSPANNKQGCERIPLKCSK